MELAKVQSINALGRGVKRVRLFSYTRTQFGVEFNRKFLGHACEKRKKINELCFIIINQIVFHS